MGVDYAPIKNGRSLRSQKSSIGGGWRRLLFLILGGLLLVAGLGAGWIIYAAKAGHLTDKAPQSPAKAASPEAPAAANQNPTTPRLRRRPRRKARRPSPPSGRPRPPAPRPPPRRTSRRLLASRQLYYCYQGKVPENRLLVVDKARQRLMVLRYLGEMSLDFEYTCSTGQQEGSKQSEGDERTPEGIYFSTHRYEDNKISIFGDRAIHLNYPNPFDQYEKRDGNGIYIHGINKTLKPRDSNGCVEMRNDELAVVANTIKEHYTPVILMDQLRLPTVAERVKACQYLENLSLSVLEEAESAVGNSLALKTGRALKESQQQEYDELANRLAGLGVNDPKLRVQTLGMGLYGLGDQWVVVAEQRILGPNRAEVAVSRRFYLRGSDPTKAQLLSSHWVLDDAQQAKLLASWAPPPKPAAVVVAAATPGPMAKSETAAEPVAEPAAPPVKTAAPERRPAPPSPAAKTAPATPEDQLRGMLSAWIKAWQGKQLGEYISFYAPEFSSEGMNRQAWQAHKAHLNQVYKVIGVEARDVHIAMLGTKAKVTFVQHYRSDWHRDVGRKSLELVLKGGHWKIVSEHWEALPGHAGLGSRGRRSNVMRSKPSMALNADRPGKIVFLPGLPGANAPGGPSMARIPSCAQTSGLNATWS